MSHAARIRDCYGLKATVCPDAGVCIDETPQSPRKPSIVVDSEHDDVRNGEKREREREGRDER